MKVAVDCRMGADQQKPETLVGQGLRLMSVVLLKRQKLILHRETRRTSLDIRQPVSGNCQQPGVR